ncbi:MAG: SUF system NifU family Fe-S cluster assembly protein [Elusimicrobia bacterium]|nr:SUF system NifU family Fe-S cluster assembly protein [Elusimicrobiota bacterium]
MDGELELQDLYRDVLLDYFRSTSHKGSLNSPDLQSEGINPVCGDEVCLTAAVKSRVLEKILFRGHGCVISQASASMMAESLEGKTLEKAKDLVQVFKSMMVQGSFEQCPEDLEELRALEGVKKYPVRVKCALLPWNTMMEGIRSVNNGNGKRQRAKYEEE